MRRRQILNHRPSDKPPGSELDPAPRASPSLRRRVCLSAGRFSARRRTHVSPAPFQKAYSRTPPSQLPPSLRRRVWLSAGRFSARREPDQDLLSGMSSKGQRTDGLPSSESPLTSRIECDFSRRQAVVFLLDLWQEGSPLMIVKDRALLEIKLQSCSRRRTYLRAPGVEGQPLVRRFDE